MYKSLQLFSEHVQRNVRRSQFSWQTVPNYRAMYSKVTAAVGCPCTWHNELACCGGSLTMLGDQITESCSTTGRTYVRYARTSKSTSRHTKARYIAAERLWALAKILLICKEGDKSCDTKTPESRADLTTLVGQHHYCRGNYCRKQYSTNI